MSSGHAVLTALAAAGTSFAVRYRKRFTSAVFLFPLFLLFWAILDHAVWNGDYSVPEWLERIHEWLGSGYRAEPLLFFLIAAALFTLGLNRLPFGRIVASRVLPAAKGLTRYEITTSGGLTYRTILGGSGQIKSVFAKIEPHHIDTGTLTNAASRTFARMLGKKTDDAGHAIGNKLGGLGSKNSGNIFPQNPTVNRGVYREFEKLIAEEVLDGKDVFVLITPKYAQGATRPFEVLYQVRINGETIGKIFKNP